MGISLYIFHSWHTFFLSLSLKLHEHHRVLAHLGENQRVNGHNSKYVSPFSFWSIYHLSKATLPKGCTLSKFFKTKKSIHIFTCCLRVRERVCVCACAWVCVRAHTHVHACVHASVRVCVCVHACVKKNEEKQISFSCNWVNVVGKTVSSRCIHVPIGQMKLPPSFPGHKVLERIFKGMLTGLVSNGPVQQSSNKLRLRCASDFVHHAVRSTGSLAHVPRITGNPLQLNTQTK